MTTIPVGFVQVTLIWEGAGLPEGAANSFGFGNLTDKSAGDCADDVVTQFGIEVLPFLASDAVLLKGIAKKGPDTTGEYAEFDYNFPGSDTSDGTSPQVTYLVQKQTALGGRQGRGRVYLPGVVEPAVNQAGQIDSAKRTQLQGGFDAWQAALDALDLPAVLLHSDSLAPTQITNYNVAARCATQRGRNRR